MKLFRTGIRALVRACRATARTSNLVGMHSRPGGFNAPGSNFQPAVVRVAQRERLLSTTARAPRAALTFRNRFRIAAASLCALALAACGGGGGGGTSTSNDSAPPPPPATYTIGGTVSGLSGTGLVLQDNGGDNLAVSGNGAFTFKTSVSSGGAYAVTVLTQPSSPTQTCTVTSGSGTATANVTSVAVTCTTPAATTFTIGGTVSGLSGTGLVLQDNGGDNLTVSGNGPFTFATAVTGAYAVTVMTQPSSPAQTCTVASGSGTATANVTSVAVTCTTAAATTFTVGGTVAGLSGTGLVLQDNGGDNLTVSANGAFTFATPVASGGAYAVTVATQPAGPAQRCLISAGTGTASANVTTVAVNCLTTGQFAYTANNSGSSISGYAINPANGQLTSIGSAVTVGSAPAAVSLSPDGKWAFSATDQGKQIYAFSINRTTGALTATPHSPFANPAFLTGHPFPDIAVDPTSKFLYLASLNDNLVVGFAINQTTGDLTQIGTSFAAGAGAGAIPAFSPNGKFLYVMNQTGNSISGYSIDPTSGSLSPIGTAAFPTGPNPTWISFRPDGMFAYVSNTNGGNAGSISVYSVDSTGALTAVGSGPVPVENGPADLTIDASGTHLYVPNRGSGTISVFSINSTDGTLTSVGPAVQAGAGPQLVVIDPTGKYAYASSSYGDDVWGYAIDPTTGNLTPVPGNPFLSGGTTGSKPLFINIDPSGQFAYTANNGTNTVSGWTIDPTSGTLTPITGTPIAAGAAPFVVSISPELPGIRD